MRKAVKLSLAKTKTLSIYNLLLVLFWGSLLVSCKEDETEILNPEASFTYQPSNLDVTFTNTSENAISYGWSFGDGNSSNEESPVYTYAEDGLYTVVLTATNASGSESTFSEEVSVVDGRVESLFSFEVSDLTVVFTDESTNAVSYLWDFGDENSSTEKNPVHTYSEPGAYVIRLTSTSAANTTAEHTQAIELIGIIPIAGFTVSIENLAVEFTNTSLDSDSYVWDFGDTNTSTEVSPMHTYEVSGSYEVILTATSIHGNTSTSSQTIEVENANAIAGFSYDRNGLTIAFTDTSSNATQWDWDFGDGLGSSTEQNPEYTFEEAGEYTVTLVVNGDESSASETFSVEVFGFINGTFDEFGLNAGVASDLYQMNNDPWEPDCQVWTAPDCGGASGNASGFRAGGMTSDGTFREDGTKTNGIKFGHEQRRGLIQTIFVEVGKTYTVTFDLATEITDEVAVFDMYLFSAPITSELELLENLYTTLQVYGSPDAAKTNFIRYEMTFTATTESLTLFGRAAEASFDGTTECWLDNVIITLD